MTNDEVNRYLHTEIMGKCWHDFSGGQWQCIKDGCGADRHKTLGTVLWPDYCSDDSPRRLLNEVVAKVLSTAKGRNDYASTLCDALEIKLPYNWVDVVAAHTPTAEQIARTCVEAHKGGANG